MKRLSNSINFYNRIASVYNLCLDWIFTPGRKYIAKVLNQKNNLSILEIGSGTGSINKHLNPQFSYFGIDGAQKMIEIASSRFSKQDFQCVRYEHYTPEKQFDSILLLYTLSTVESPEHLLEKAAKWLKPDGKLYIVNHFSSTHFLYKGLQNLSIHFGYNAYFPFKEKLFSKHFKITTFESVNLLGGWKFIVLEHK